MTLDAETRRRLLELVYDVLPEDEAAPLRERIDAEAELAQAFAEAQEAAALLREAGKLHAPRIELKPPESPDPASAPAVARPASTRRAAAAKGAAGPPKRLPAAPWTRMANVVAWLSSAILLLISLIGYGYHRGQLADISAEHLRLRVVGPAQLHPGVASQFAVTTSAVTGKPVSAQIDFALYWPDGQNLLMGHKEKTDEKGHLLVTVPADTPVSTGMRLMVVATHNDKVERIDTRLVVEPERAITQLIVDRPRYRPGDVVRYRSLTLARFRLAPDRSTPIHFEIHDPRGQLVLGSEADRTAQQGVACGQFSLPPDAPAGTYTLIARSPDGVFAEARLPFAVGDAVPGSKPEPANLEQLKVNFYPEGGRLVAGLENRVYFSAQDGEGKPVPLTGRIVDDQGEEVAAVEATPEGMGTFSLKPLAGDTYRLRIQTPAGVKVEPRLPEVVTQPGVVLATGLGVFEPGERLEFNVRAIQDNLPLVVAAYCRGVLVGHQTLVTAQGANEVTVELDENASGLIRLIVFDYRDNPPRPVAERMIFRRPSRRLYVQMEEPRRPYRPGQQAEMSLIVTDEMGRPARAMLGISVVDEAVLPAAHPSVPLASTHFLLDAPLSGPGNPKDLDSYLAAQPQADVTLDLLLGTWGGRRLADEGSRKKRKEGTEKTARGIDLAAEAPLPPAVYDNLSDLRERYQESLVSYRSSRTRALSTLTTLSFFGGAGLLLLATMLTLMNVTAGLWLWIPVVVSAATCLWVGTRLVSLATLDSRPDVAVAYAPFQVEPEAPGPDAAEKPYPDSSATSPAAPSEQQKHTFDTCEYAYHDRPNATAGTLYWHPAVRTDADGRTKIQFDLPSAFQGMELRVDAHAAGRIGSLKRQIRLEK